MKTKKIEIRLPFVLSLLSMSYSGAEESSEAEETEQKNPLEMSDEDFESQVEPQAPEEEEEEETPDEEEESEEKSEPESEEESEESESKKDTEKVEENTSTDTETKTDKDITEEKEENPLNGALAPLKASGRITTIRNVDHLRALAQQGIDYNKKMQALKPSLGVLRMLEKEDLLDPDKINLLVEAGKGKPEAIQRLMQDAEIDPLNFVDEEQLKQAETYSPQNYIPSSAEVAIEEVLLEIQESPTYSKTIDHISNNFSEKSRMAVSERPEYIRLLNADMESGAFATVMEEIEYRQAIGLIPLGSSGELDVYINVAKELSQRGTDTQQGTQTKVETRTPETTQQTKTNSSSTKRKQSMGGSRSSGKNTKNNNFNPLSLSDEDFAKLDTL